MRHTWDKRFPIHGTQSRSNFEATISAAHNNYPWAWRDRRCLTNTPEQSKRRM